jgi:hypothetical protein
MNTFLCFSDVVPFRARSGLRLCGCKKMCLPDEYKEKRRRKKHFALELRSALGFITDD